MKEGKHFSARLKNANITSTFSKPTSKLMKYTIKFVVTGMGVLLLAACASMTNAPSASPSATVRIKEWSAAYYGSAAVGKGTLNYRGQLHHFTISGLGAGGMGAQKVSATGTVYNLNNLFDFSGTYRGVSRGLTLLQGKMHAKMTNDNGVVMYLAGETEGLASSLGVQAFEVNLTD
jgi:hypothetical protein